MNDLKNSNSSNDENKILMMNNAMKINSYKSLINSTTFSKYKYHDIPHINIDNWNVKEILFFINDLKVTSRRKQHMTNIIRNINAHYDDFFKHYKCKHILFTKDIPFCSINIRSFDIYESKSPKHSAMLVINVREYYNQQEIVTKHWWKYTLPQVPFWMIIAYVAIHFL